MVESISFNRSKQLGKITRYSLAFTVKYLILTVTNDLKNKTVISSYHIYCQNPYLCRLNIVCGMIILWCWSLITGQGGVSRNWGGSDNEVTAYLFHIFTFLSVKTNIAITSLQIPKLTHINIGVPLSSLKTFMATPVYALSYLNFLLLCCFTLTKRTYLFKEH